MCQYKDYVTVTKQAAAAKARGEFDYAHELLRGRAYPTHGSYRSVYAASYRMTASFRSRAYL